MLGCSCWPSLRQQRYRTRGTASRTVQCKSQGVQPHGQPRSMLWPTVVLSTIASPSSPTYTETKNQPLDCLCSQLETSAMCGPKTITSTAATRRVSKTPRKRGMRSLSELTPSTMQWTTPQMSSQGTCQSPPVVSFHRPAALRCPSTRSDGHSNPMSSHLAETSLVPQRAPM